MSATLKIKKIIETHLNDDETILLADGYEEAFVGIGRKFDATPFAVYDRSKCIKKLIEDGLNMEEAEEFFQFNVEGAYVGENTPVFVSMNYQG
jgi:hypothetical protein